MPYTSEGIFYADNSTEMSVADISSAMATSISDQVAILREGGIVTSDLERDELYPVPEQGNTVFRSDKGLRQTYFELYNAGTNPGGKAVAGWYDETRIFVQATTPSSPNNGDLWFW